MSTQILRVRRGEVKLNASHIAGYAAAATAGALAGTAQATITYSGPLNTVVADTTLNGQAVAVDLTFGAAPAHLALAHGIGTTNAATGYAFTAPQGFGTPGVEVAGFLAGGYNYVTNVALNAPISALPNFLGPTINATMAFNAGYGNDQFLAAGDAFMGVRFNTNQYGWVHVRMNGAPLNSFTIVDFAFAGPGEVIHAGEVPAPGCLGALALGGAGLMGWRRRKAA
jgi:hypothetical protein